MTLVCQPVHIMTKMYLQNSQSHCQGCCLTYKLVNRAYQNVCCGPEDMQKYSKFKDKCFSVCLKAAAPSFSLNAAFPPQTKINKLFTSSEDLKILPPFANSVLCFSIFSASCHDRDLTYSISKAREAHNKGREVELLRWGNRRVHKSNTRDYI